MSYKPAPLKPKRAIEQAYISKASGKPVEFLPGEGFKLERQEQTMLFDMVNDPWEHNNLSSESKYRDIIAQHEQMLASYEQDIIPGHSFTRK